MLLGRSGPCLSITNRPPRVLVAFSGPFLSATNRNPVLPCLGGSFWPTLIRYKISPVLVSFSGPLLSVQILSVTNHTPLLAFSWPGLSVARVLVALSGPLLSNSRLLAAHRTSKSWCFFLAHPYVSNSYSRFLVARSGTLLSVTYRTSGF